MKQFKAATLKQIDERGHGRAVFATLNVVDKDGDVTEPGAFGEQEVFVLPTHNWGSVPLGKGRISEEGDQAVVDFQLNLDTEAGREWHQALKFDMANGTPLQEWSYGFTIKESEQETRDGESVRVLKAMDVHEVSPVIVGAGEGTRTLAVKHGGTKTAVRGHSTSTSDQTWDGGANERNLPSPMPIGTARDAYAWIENSQVEDGEMPKSSGRFIHHFVTDAGEPGAASTRACITGIGVLNGARGGTTIPDSDRRGVFEHLAAHLRDADEDVPELRSYDECAMKLSDQIRFACWDAEAALERAKTVKAARAEDGRDLSPDRYADVGDLRKALDSLHATAKALDEVLRKGDGTAEAESLLTEFEHVQARIKGHVAR